MEDRKKEDIPKEIQPLIFQAKKELQEIFDSTHDAITIHDTDFRIIRANRAAETLLGLPFHKILRQPCYALFHGTDAPSELCPGCQTLKSGEPTVTEFYEPKLGKHLEIRSVPRFNLEKKLIGIIHIARDITRQKHLERELLSLSLSDELTGLYNRRGCLTLGEQYLKLINRQKKGIFMLYADLDNMKWINDTLGHKAGDLALIEVASLLKENYRESDIIARIGGDEFVVLPVGTCQDRVELIESRLHRALKKYNAKSDQGYDLSISVGIAFYDPEHVSTIDELLDVADKLMYDKKKSKKG